MAIRIPPPSEFDRLSPDAKQVVEDATQQMTSWIEQNVDEIHRQTMKTIADSVESARSELEKIDDDISTRLVQSGADMKTLTDEVSSWAEALGNQQMSANEFSAKLGKELAEREQRYSEMGKNAVKIAGKALSGVLNVPL
jgi:methyl-accepting chemotaxis protein